MQVISVSSQHHLQASRGKMQWYENFIDNIWIPTPWRGSYSETRITCEVYAAISLIYLDAASGIPRRYPKVQLTPHAYLVAEHNQYKFLMNEDYIKWHSEHQHPENEEAEDGFVDDNGESDIDFDDDAEYDGDDIFMRSMLPLYGAVRHGVFVPRDWLSLMNRSTLQSWVMFGIGQYHSRAGLMESIIMDFAPLHPEKIPCQVRLEFYNNKHWFIMEDHIETFYASMYAREYPTSIMGPIN